MVGLSDAGGWIWDATNGTRLLSNLVPSGWTIYDAAGISQNGLILARASYNGGLTEWVMLDPGTPSIMTASAGTTPQSASINTAFANPPAVTVTDVASSPISGVNVTFAAPATGASGIFSNSTTTITVATNALGVASAPFTANGTAGGPYTVTASVAGLPIVNFSLTNTAGTPPPPAAPVLTSPANGATAVSQSAYLTWTAAAGATSYDVYLGTPSVPAFVVNTTATAFSPVTLAPATTYYWYVAARNSTGVTPSAAVWTFTTSNAIAPPSPAGVSPAAGTGTTQTFTFSFTDPNGFADLSVLDILIDNYLDGTGACYVALVPSSANSGYLYLVDDAGDGGYASGTPMSLPSSGSLANSQCTISGTGSSVSGSGNTLTATLNITFTPSFAGNKIFYMAARSATQNSGWQALGTWDVSGMPPTGPGVGGVTPGRSITTGQTYTFTFTDTNGYPDLAVLDILTNSFLDGIGACYAAYVPTGATTGYLYLVDDAGDGGYASGSPILLSSGGTLSNSQCSLDTAASSASASGDTLNLNLAITFTPSFAGNQVFYLASRNSGAGNSGWQAVGAVTVP
ncbi:MAG TPA: hypothetical protein VGG72_01300 [Bryobacteraceae bacterium]